VRVRVSRQPRDGHSDTVVFEIEDTGVGIPSAHLPLIFEAFHQVDGTFGRRHKGTGLGLTISREIARAMGGDITCTSVLGKGATFTLAVPLAPTQVNSVDLALPLGDDAPAAPPQDTSATPNAAHAAHAAHAHAHAAAATVASPAIHVLLAEDNPVNALVAEATLANLGVQVTRVEDGAQALTALQRPHHPFALVLMDCQMPVLDGIEATRRLRVWEHNQGVAPIPVIALTANAMNSDRERCMAAGMDEHLPKPFRQDELQAALQRHLGGTHSAATSRNPDTAGA
jgi:CheY-like chemotaxis protein